MTIGQVSNAKRFYPYFNEVYDLIGEDIDRISRIKQMGSENLFIADEGFVNALSENGGGFEKFFDGVSWKQNFKGIKKPVRFYGKDLPKVT